MSASPVVEVPQGGDEQPAVHLTPLPWRVVDGPLKVLMATFALAWVVLLVGAVLLGAGMAAIAASGAIVPVILGAAVVTGWRWHRAALRRSR